MLPFASMLSGSPVAALPTGSRLEFSPLSCATVAQVSDLLRQSKAGGSGLIIDYGKESAEGDTFRVRWFTSLTVELLQQIDQLTKAFKGHRQVHPLESPGTADLTASVNFGLLKLASKEAHPNGE